ncbi:hypothetical protein AVEN_184679-1 [Araneus ventricosus]|uniref:Uncharacterized protein n=1 Tax=Araneus ventricosus TaxID=182803 RepID=A0A4Y2FVK2_ARAVE|nr:hypothetical protein AVEN_184679-1 [Araneus ventricosus]
MRDEFNLMQTARTPPETHLWALSITRRSSKPSPDPARESYRNRHFPSRERASERERGKQFTEGQREKIFGISITFIRINIHYALRDEFNLMQRAPKPRETQL